MRKRRVYGYIYTLPNGRQFYLANRSHKHIWRNKKNTIDQAVKLKCAAWAIDTYTLRQLQLKGITIVGVYDRDMDDIYLTGIDLFLGSIVPHDYTGVGGSNQKIVHLHRMKYRAGLSAVK